MNTTLPATKARKHFFKLIEKANRPGSIFTITLGGEPKVVMMPVDDFEGWLETLEIISDKKLMASIEKALKEKKVYTEEEIKKEFHLE